MIALREGSHFVPFTVSTELEVGPFTKRGVGLVRLLSPHICRASKIGLALELKTLSTQRLETTLNSLSAGVYLVSRVGKILFMNTAAEAQIKRNKGLSVSNNRLTPKDAAAATALTHALSGVAHSDTSSVSVALPDPSGGWLQRCCRLKMASAKTLAACPPQQHSRSLCKTLPLCHRH